MTPFAEVIGDPVAHSKSPTIHLFWLGKVGLDADYRATHVRPDELGEYIASRRRDPAWRGCNVTIPHKQSVIRHIDRRDSVADEVGAVNTVIAKPDRTLCGYNTDVEGVLAALPPALMSAGAEVCLIGTGGAARAALAALVARGIGIVLFSARDQAAAERLRSEFKLGGSIAAIDNAHNIQTAEVIINATPLGMAGKPPMPQAILDHLDNPVSPDVVVFDMVYAPLETPLLAAARARGLRAVDGLEMLVGQAAVAFELFFGRPAPRQHDVELRELLLG